MFVSTLLVWCVCIDVCCIDVVGSADVCVVGGRIETCIDTGWVDVRIEVGLISAVMLAVLMFALMLCVSMHAFTVVVKGLSGGAGQGSEGMNFLLKAIR